MQVFLDKIKIHQRAAAL